MLPLVAFTHAPPWSVTVFTLLCAGIVLALLMATWYTAAARNEAKRSVLQLTVIVGIYLFVIAGIVSSGVMKRSFFPYALFFFAGILACTFAAGFSPIAARIALRTPITCLVAFQSFRFPLELILHHWYLEHTIPESMTWTGSNWDIISGIVALLAAPFSGHRLWLAWLANIVGIVLLVNVVRCAVLSAPVPFGWNVDPPLELILYLPYAYIVPVCVGGAALGHLLLTRRLLAEHRGRGDLPIND